MSQKIQVDAEEVIRLFNLLEELNWFFHDPSHYPDVKAIQDFLGDVNGGIYREIWDMYYHVVWNWLPPEVKAQIEKR